MSELKSKEWGLYKGQKIAVSINAVFFDDVKPDTFIMKGFDEGLILKCEERIMEIESKYCKPILRGLNQMTEEEKNEFECLVSETAKYIYVQGNKITNPLITDWLTQKGFAIRQEFERGVAIKEENNEGTNIKRMAALPSQTCTMQP